MTSEVIRTGDGSLTCRHPGYGEAYHAVQGALSEARTKFIVPSALAGRLFSAPVRLLDIGFGLGVNVRAAAALPRAHLLRIDSLELEPDALERARELYPDCELTRSLAESGHARADLLEVQLIFGDARRTLSTLSGPYDLIFHDPFSPLKNTECWTVEFFHLLRGLIHPRGLLLTYSESKAVRAGLREAGWQVGASPACPPHRGGTMASPDAAMIPEPVYVEGFAFQDNATLSRTGREIRAAREARVRGEN